MGTYPTLAFAHVGLSISVALTGWVREQLQSLILSNGLEQQLILFMAISGSTRIRLRFTHVKGP